MKSSKVFKWILIIIALIFFGNQIISSLYKPVKTETAVFKTISDGIKINGYIIRKETVIESSKDGVMHFLTADGNRVAKNGVIANIYGNESASLTVSKIDLLQKQISDIEGILSYNDVEAANLEIINAKVKTSLNDLVFASSAGDYTQNASLKGELLSFSNRKQAALGVTTGLAERLDSLKSELSSLSGSLPSPVGSIRSEESGYFVSKTDGYESVLGTGNLDKITPEFLDNMKPSGNGENIGKIVSDYEWYIAARVSINDSLKYKEDDTLKITTSVKSSPVLSVKVKKINISENDETAVIIFSCNEMNNELAVIRNGAMTVVNKEYSGLAVPKKALRVVDSVRGVYVQNGMQINFVPVEIVYTTDDYLICEKKNENGNYLKLYDKVVVKGKNLYDGKIIR